MNIVEYKKVKNLDYREYCDYLRSKYGLPKKAYMTENWSKNAGNSRTKEGLVVHHVFEDRAERISDSDTARNYPYKWQLPENLVYCDYLEHLYLHILICEFDSLQELPVGVGIGGVVHYIGVELNDFYSGFVPRDWKSGCCEKVKDDEDVYFALLRRFFDCEKRCDPAFTPEVLCKSFNAQFNLWSDEADKEIFAKIVKLFDEAG